MDKEKYNGWTNFATWKVNLEILDGLTTSYFYGEESIDLDDPIYDLATRLEDYVDEFISMDQIGLDQECVALTYARAFMYDVNWREIAMNMLENERLEA